MPNNDMHILAAFAGAILLIYTHGLPDFLLLLFFMFGAVIASFKKFGKIYGLSPDLDCIGILKKLFGHRSVIFHSPLIPIIILNLLNLNFACERFWECSIIHVLIYGFCFGWLIHIIADGIQNIHWWDIPLKNTKKSTRTILGITCCAFTLITLLSIYFINSEYLQNPNLQEVLLVFKDFVLQS